MKQIICILIIFTGILLVPSAGWSHGEETPGPHGGAIQMPGAFHTEVVPVDENTFKIYLLDISFAEPVTRDSWVKASLVFEGKNQAASCKVEKDYFFCILPKESNLKSGKLEVQAKRLDQEGVLMTHELPFVDAKTSKHEDHKH